MLLIICGYPGTGKSFLARKLAKRLNALHFSSDKIRKKLFQKPNYSKEESELVYSTLLQLADLALSQKRNVILDATFARAIGRKQALEIARAHAVPLYLVQCIASDVLVKERLSRGKDRQQSDADYKIYQKIKREFEPIKEKHLTLDTSHSFKEQFSEILDFIKRERKKQKH